MNGGGDDFARFLADLRRSRTADAYSNRREVVGRARSEIAAMRKRLAALEAAEVEAERLAPSLFSLAERGEADA